MDILDYPVAEITVLELWVQSITPLKISWISSLYYSYNSDYNPKFQRHKKWQWPSGSTEPKMTHTQKKKMGGNC